VTMRKASCAFTPPTICCMLLLLLLNPQCRCQRLQRCCRCLGSCCKQNLRAHSHPGQPSVCKGSLQPFPQRACCCSLSCCCCYACRCQPLQRCCRCLGSCWLHKPREHAQANHQFARGQRSISTMCMLLLPLLLVHAGASPCKGAAGAWAAAGI
jgi:hypothetical protein